jgi:WD40 repeat protein
MKQLFLNIFFILAIVACSPSSVTPDSNTNPATVAPPTSTALPTPIPLPSLSPTPEFPVRDGGTLQPGNTVISKDNLSQVIEIAVWGNGVIKDLQWSDDGKQIFVDTSLGRYAYDSTSFELIERELEFTQNNPGSSFNVEDLGSSTDSFGRLKKQFRVQVIINGKSTGSFDVDTLYMPRVKYLSESNTIVVDKMMGGVELRDGTSFEIFCNTGGSWESPFTITKERTMVAAGAMDGYIIVQSGDGLSNEVHFEAGGPVRFLSFSPDGSKLVSETNGNISIWDVSSGKTIGTFPDTFLSGNFYYDQYHYGTDARVGLTVKDNKIAYINKNIVTIRNLLDGKQSGSINGKEGILLDKEYKYEGNYQEIDSVLFAAEGQSLITVSYDRSYVWDLATNQFVKMIALEKEKQHFGLVAVYSAPSNLLLTGSQAGSYLKFWNVDSGIELPSISAWNVGQFTYGYDGTHSLTMSPDGKFVFSWSGLEGVASFWEIETNKRAMALKIPRSEYSQYKPGFYPVAISPDNTKLIFSYSLSPEMHIATVYSIPDGNELYRISQYFSVFSPDGSVIAASVGSNRIRFYDSETGNTLGDVTSKYPNQDGFQLLYFSKDGKSLIAVSTNGTIGIWGIP